MKRIFSVVLSILIFSLSAVPAFAAETRYIPVIPEFITVSGTMANVDIPIDKSSPEIQSFFSDFYNQNYLIVIDQWTATSYYPQYANTAVEQKFIGDDRKWSISFIRPNAENTKKNYDFVYYDPLLYPTTEPRPMSVNMGYGSFGLTVLTYHYDFATKSFGSGTIYNNVTRQNFSWVIGSAALSNASSNYPFYNRLAGEIFTVSSYAQGGVPCPYNWWLGRSNIGNDVKPKPTPTPTPPPIPPSPTPPPWRPDPPTYPDWGDIEPDNPILPFDPDNNNGGYVPPPSDGGFNPLPPDFVIPSIPDIPPPPTVPGGGYNPFDPPTVPGGGYNPFDPPTVPGGGYNPFDPPIVPGGGYNPFDPPIVPGGGYNPFDPPGIPLLNGASPFLYRPRNLRYVDPFSYLLGMR